MNFSGFTASLVYTVPEQSGVTQSQKIKELRSLNATINSDNFSRIRTCTKFSIVTHVDQNNY